MKVKDFVKDYKRITVIGNCFHYVIRKNNSKYGGLDREVLDLLVLNYHTVKDEIYVYVWKEKR